MEKKSLFAYVLQMLFVLMLVSFSPSYLGAIDTDKDGIEDSIDLDDDNDGILDTDEGRYGSMLDFNTLEASTATPGNPVALTT
ncbi:MAG: hypothetical protein U9N11_00965, partial [Campylobacterota bacterium]|nr:hypothetical protein [Campylobacterota bacterium]